MKLMGCSILLLPALALSLALAPGRTYAIASRSLHGVAADDVADVAAAASSQAWRRTNRCGIPGCTKCRRRPRPTHCVTCMDGMVLSNGTCAPHPPCVPGQLCNGGGGGGGATNAYGVSFQSGFASVSCYDVVEGGFAKCGNSLAYADLRPSAPINFEVAIPLAYWPKPAYGNCADCGIRCAGTWGPNNAVVDAAGQQLCYRIRNRAGTGRTYTIRVADSCGGNCPNPPGMAGMASATRHPPCGPQGASNAFDCAEWAKAFVDGGGAGTDVAYTEGGIYRCPVNQECKTNEWYGGFYPAGNATTCPPNTYWTDFCGGSYMHFDLITQVAGGPSCNVAPNAIYDLCGPNGHCVVEYERIPCPAR